MQNPEEETKEPVRRRNSGLKKPNLTIEIDNSQSGESSQSSVLVC